MIPTTLNVFMNVIVQPTGELKIDPPPSKAEITSFFAPKWI
jgi:uncharacterized protein YcgI (DUF1989 family)